LNLKKGLKRGIDAIKLNIFTCSEAHAFVYSNEPSSVPGSTTQTQAATSDPTPASRLQGRGKALEVWEFPSPAITDEGI
jgi:hypothetical protein